MAVGYLLAFLFMLCLTTGIFLFGYLSRKSAAETITFIEIVVGFLLISLLLLYQKTDFLYLLTRPSLSNWIYLGAAAATGFIGGNYFSLVNLKWGGEVFNSLLSPAITATVVLLSVAVNRSALTTAHATGIVIILGSIVMFLLTGTAKKLQVIHPSKAFWSGLATIGCISATILFSVKGAAHISIFHALWLRLLMALPLAIALLFVKKETRLQLSPKLYFISLVAVAVQTVAGSYLWFTASFKIGVPLFQTIVAMLPFWVYAVDVFWLKRSKPSVAFVVTAVVAVVGVMLLVW